MRSGVKCGLAWILVGIELGCTQGPSYPFYSPRDELEAQSRRRVECSETKKAVTLQARVLSVDGGINVALTVCNGTLGPIWLNGRFLVNREDWSPREVWLDIRDELGAQYDYDCMARLVPGRSSAYLVLRHGEGISGLEKSVDGCYQLRKGHTYTLVAHYQDGTVTPPSPPGDAQYLSNELVAPPVEFQF
jgi:hypothetical protein